MRRGAYLTSAPQPLHPMIFQARKRACPHTVSHVTCVQIFFSMPHHRDRHYRDHTLHLSTARQNEGAPARRSAVSCSCDFSSTQARLTLPCDLRADFFLHAT